MLKIRDSIIKELYLGNCLSNKVYSSKGVFDLCTKFNECDVFFNGVYIGNYDIMCQNGYVRHSNDVIDNLTRLVISNKVEERNTMFYIKDVIVGFYILQSEIVTYIDLLGKDNYVSRHYFDTVFEVV